MIILSVNPQETALIKDWPEYLTAGLLVMVRLSGLFVFAPVFSSAAISMRVKAGFVFAMTALLAPSVSLVPGARPVLDYSALLGELGVGLIFGFSLSLLNEALNFAGAMLGMEFSFSLVKPAGSQLQGGDGGTGADAGVDGDPDPAGSGVGPDDDRGVGPELHGGSGGAWDGAGVDRGGDGADDGWDLPGGAAAGIAGDCGGAGRWR